MLKSHKCDDILEEEIRYGNMAGQFHQAVKRILQIYHLKKAGGILFCETT